MLTISLCITGGYFRIAIHEYYPVMPEDANNWLALGAIHWIIQLFN